MAEIELKAHAGNYRECKKRLEAIAGVAVAISKDDTYWLAPGVLHYYSGPRVRQETAGNSVKTLVTWKNKQKVNGIEVNDEHELEVSDKKVFEELLVQLGLEKQIEKHKEGWAWQYSGITAELCKVSGAVRKNPKKTGAAKKGRIKNLGWFLELEIISNEDSKAAVALTRKKLLTLLAKAGIDEGDLESRYYAEMLGTEI